MKHFSHKAILVIILILHTIPCYSELSVRLNKKISNIEQNYSMDLIPALLRLTEELLRNINYTNDEITDDNSWSSFDTIINKTQLHVEYMNYFLMYFTETQKRRINQIKETLQGLKQFKELYARGKNENNISRAKKYYDQAFIKLSELPIKIKISYKVTENKPKPIPPLKTTEIYSGFSDSLPLHPKISKEIYSKDSSSTQFQANIDEENSLYTKTLHFLKNYEYPLAISHLKKMLLEMKQNKQRQGRLNKNSLIISIKQTETILSVYEKIIKTYHLEPDCYETNRLMDDYIKRKLSFSENMQKTNKYYKSIFTQEMIEYHQKYLHHINWVNFGDCRLKEKRYQDAIENYEISLKFILHAKLKDYVNEKIERASKLDIMNKKAVELLHSFNYEHAIEKFKQSGQKEYENLAKELWHLENKENIHVLNDVNQLLYKYGHIFDGSEASLHRRHLRFVKKLRFARRYYEIGDIGKAKSYLDDAEFFSETPAEKKQVQKFLNEIINIQR